MARSRNIKPSFFTNDELAEIPALGRLLFVALWTMADREGRLEDRPKRIKAEALPYDDCDCDELLSELAKRGFIVRYQAGEGRFIQVVNFTKHQNPHVKESPSSIPAPDKHSASTVQARCEAQPEPERAGLIPDSGFLIPDSPSLIPDSPSRIPDSGSLRSQRARVTPVDLSIAMRQHGIESQPADPRLIALAEQGVSVETVEAACKTARAAKPNERISPAYVVAIVERWAKDAAGIEARGARSPPARASPPQSRYAATIAALTGRSDPQPEDVIDVESRTVSSTAAAIAARNG